MNNARATGADIIEAMIDNLHTHLEPIYYTAQAPSLYHIYLHKNDFNRLKGVFPQIIGEAKRALDDEVKKLNRKGVVASLREAVQKRLALAIKDRLGARPGIVYQTPKEGWQIAFYPDADGELKPGDVAIVSELAAPLRMEYGEGNPTMTVRTIKRTEQAPQSAPAQPDRAPKRKAGRAAKPKPARPAESRQAQATQTPQPPAQAHSAQPTGSAPAGPIYAIIRYCDAGGAHTFQVMKSLLVIGRGGKNMQVDLKLKTDSRVSREHLRLRRDPRTGAFYLEDLSSYGVTVNGKKIPGRAEAANGDDAAEFALPSRAQIVLADVVTLEFMALEEAGGYKTK
jgi:hypothetical protein